MLPEKFFEAYSQTGEAPASDPEEASEPKTYTAAEVDALVNERVAAAIEEIKKSFNEPDSPVERTNNHEENNSNEEA